MTKKQLKVAFDKWFEEVNPDFDENPDTFAPDDLEAAFMAGYVLGQLKLAEKK